MALQYCRKALRLLRATSDDTPSAESSTELTDSSRPSQNQTFFLETLEPRILLSADPLTGELARIADDAANHDLADQLVIVEILDDTEEAALQEADGTPIDGEPGIDWPEAWTGEDEGAEFSDDGADVDSGAPVSMTVAVSDGPIDLVELINRIMQLEVMGNLGALQHKVVLFSKVAPGDDPSGSPPLDPATFEILSAGQVEGNGNGTGSDTPVVLTEQAIERLQAIAEEMSAQRAEGAEASVDLGGLTIVFADLQDGELARIADGILYLDITANGLGWDLGTAKQPSSSGQDPEAFTVTAIEVGLEAASMPDATFDVSAQPDLPDVDAAGAGAVATTVFSDMESTGTASESNPRELEELPVEVPGPAGDQQVTIETGAPTAFVAPASEGREGTERVQHTDLSGVQTPDAPPQGDVTAIALATGLSVTARAKDDSDDEVAEDATSDDASSGDMSAPPASPHGNGDPANAAPPDQARQVTPHPHEGRIDHAFAILQDGLPRAPPAFDAMPRAPPEGDYLRFDGDAIPPSGALTEIGQDELDALFRHAITLWSGTDLTPEQLELLSELTVSFDDLSGSILGTIENGAILLDRDAAGFGWFVDATPDDSDEFVLDESGTLLAAESSDAEGRIDLLTVLLHEVGHGIGLDHGADLDVMQDTLGAGVRILPGDSAPNDFASTTGAATASENLVAGVAPVAFGSITFHAGSEAERLALEDILNSPAPLATLTFNADIDLDGFVHLTGVFEIAYAGLQTVDIATGLPSNATDLLNTFGSSIDDQSVSTWTLTATNVQAFVGLNGPYQSDTDGNGVIEGAEMTNVDQDAVGLSISNLDVAAVLMTPITPAIPSLHALKATASSAQLVGMDEVATATALDITVTINSAETWPGGFGPPVVDFASSFPGGYTVGAFDFSDLDGNQRIGATADTVELGLANFVHVIGSFSFEKGPTQKVDVATGLPANFGDLVEAAGGALDVLSGGLTGLVTTDPGDGTLWIEPNLSVIHNVEVDSMQIGTSGAHAFVGLNGPYRSDTNGDGFITDADGAPDPDAAGLVIENVDFGFVTMAPTLAALPGFDEILPTFTAMKATADLAGLVGIDEILTATARDIVIEVNDGTAWPGDLGPPVVDFSASYATDEIADFFDVGADGITVGDLRSLTSETELAGLYDIGTEDTLVLSTAEVLEALAGMDGILDSADLSAAGFTLGAGGISFTDADADGDGKLDPPGYEVRTGTSTAPVYLDYDGNQRIGATADTVELGLANFVHVIGSFSFEKGPTHRVNTSTGLPLELATGLQALDDLIDGLPTSDPGNGSLWVDTSAGVIHNVEVDSMQIGTSGAHAFVGVNGPYRSDTNGDGFITDADDPADEQAIGLVVENVDFGFVTMAPTLGSLPGLDGILPTFTAIKATSDLAAFVGVDELDMSLEGIEINVNQGTAWPGNIGTPILNFATSFDTDEIADFFDIGGNGITVGDLRTLGGGAALPGLYASTDADSLLVDSGTLLEVLGRDDGILDSADLSAAGFTTGAGGIGFTEADADGDGKLDPSGYEIRTGTSTPPVYIDYSGSLVRASAEWVTIRISEFIHVAGSVAFEMGPAYDVDVTGGLLTSLGSDVGDFLVDRGLPADLVNSYPVLGGDSTRLSFMTIGASNVHAFVGLDGPYWIDDLDGDRRISWALPDGEMFDAQTVIDGVTYEIGDPTDGITLTASDGTALPTVTVNGVEYGDLDGDGEVDPGETAELSGEAAGILVNDFDFGMSLMKPVSLLDFAKYYALKATAEQLSLVGIDDVTLDADQLLVEVNQSSPAIYGLPLFPVVDFASTPDFASEQLALFDEDGDGALTLGDLATLDDLLAPADRFDALDGVVLNDSTIVDHETLLGILNTDNTGDSFEVIDIVEAAALLGGDAAAVTAAQGADADGDGKIDPLGFEVNTGGAPVYLAMNSSLIRAQGFLELNVFDNLYLTGSVAFELGPTQQVELTNGDTPEVTTMTIGAANVTAFIGDNGPYWTDIDGDGEITPNGSYGGTGPIGTSESDELSSSAIGFHITDFDIGLLLMASTAIDELGVYLAGKASVDSFGLVGVDVVEATGRFDVAINVGLGTSGVAVVDFDRSFNEQLALFDRDGNGTITVEEIRELTTGSDAASGATGALSGLYSASDPGSAELALEDIVALLDAAGNDDGLLQVSEAEAVLNDPELAADNDNDVDGRLDAGFEVYTAPATAPVVLDFTEFLISFQLGGTVTIHTDAAQTNPVVRLNGLLLFEVDPSGLGAFVAAGLEFGPDIGSSQKFFDLNALGGLVINAQGVAADIDISVAVGAALGSLSADAGAQARLVFNMTGVDQTITIPARYVEFLDGTVDLASSQLGADLSAQGGADVAAIGNLAGTLDSRFRSNADSSVTFTIFGTAPSMSSLFPGSSVTDPSTGSESSVPLADPGAYFAIAISGNITISSNWGLDGRFGLIVSGDGLQISAEANLMMGPLGSLYAAGDIIISDEGLLARVAVRGTLGSSTIGLEISASGLFEINTTSMSQTLQGETVNQGLRVAIAGNFDFLSFAQGSGSAVIVFENSSFQLVINGDLTIGGVITFDVFAFVGIFSDGVVIDIAVNLDVDNILSILDFDLSGRLQINTTGSAKSSYTGADFDANGNLTNFRTINFVDANGNPTSIAENSFLLDLRGELVLLNALTITGGLVIEVAGDAWSITVPSSSPLSVDIFGVFTLQIWGYINSDGAFDLNLRGGVDFTIGGNGIAGTISMSIYLDTSRNPDFRFTASGNVSAQLGGTDLVGASVSLDARGNLGQSVPITLTVRGTGTVIEYIEGALSWLASAIWGHEVEVTLSFTLPIGTIYLPSSLENSTPPPPLLAGQANGSEWDDVAGGTLYLNVGDRATHRNQQKTVTQEQYTITRTSNGGVRISALGSVEEYANVTRIVGDFGSDTDTVSFINFGGIDVDVSGGSSGDVMSYTGTGQAILRGDGGDDNISLAGTPAAGSEIYGGADTDTLTNNSFTDVPIYGESGNDTITGGFGDDSMLSGGADNDRIQGRSGLDNAIGGAGIDTFSEELSDLKIGETFGGGTTGGDAAEADQVILVGVETDGELDHDYRVTIDGSNQVTVSAYDKNGTLIGSIRIDQVEIVNIAGEFGSDKFSAVGALDLGGVTDVVFDIGSVTESDMTHSPDGGQDQVDLVLTDSNDALDLEPADMGIRGEWASHLTFAILMGYVVDADQLNVHAGGGNDTITVGGDDADAGVVGVNGLDGFVTVHGDAGTDTLNIDDAADTGINAGVLTGSTISGLGLDGSVTYGTVEAVNVDLGSGADTFNVRGTSVSTTVDMGTGSAANTVNVGSAAPSLAGNVNSLAAELTITGQSAGTDTVNVDDSADGATNNGTLTSTRLNGLGTAGIVYAGIDVLDIGLGTGDDTFNILGTSAETTVLTGAGVAANTINVGSLAPSVGGTLNALDGKLIVAGQSAGTETLNLDDTGDGAANTGTLTSTRLTGLGMAAGDTTKGVEYSGLSALNLGLGSGADILTVESTHAGSTDIDGNDGGDIFNIRTVSGTTTIDGGAESETFNVGSQAAGTASDPTDNSGGTLDAITGLLVLNGDAPSANSDVLNVDDSGDTGDNTGTLTSTQITGLGMTLGITYGTIETLNMFLGSAVDTLTVMSTHAEATNINANPGADIVNIRSIAGTTSVDTGAGADNVNVGSNASGDASDRDNNAGGTVNAISALLTIDGAESGSDIDTLTVDDTADTADNTGVLTEDRLRGLGMGDADQSAVNMALGIVYRGQEVLVMSLGSGADTFTIEDTHNGATAANFETTLLHTGSGTDLIVINDVSDFLTVNGEGDSDTFNVNGTGPGSTSTLNGDGDNDIFNIRAIDGAANLNGDGGGDTINVGSDAPTLPGTPTTKEGTIDAINALLTVDGGGDAGDVMNVDDSDPGNTAKSGALTEATLRGLELESGIDYTGLEDLNIWLAIGANVFTINGTHAGTTTLSTATGTDTVDINDANGLLTINAEAGDDTVNIRATSLGSEVRINGQGGADTVSLSDTSPTLPAEYAAILPPSAADTVGKIDGIDGLIVIDGGTEVDVTNVDDSGNTLAKSGVLTSTTLRGLALPAGVAYTELEDLNIWLGTGADVLFIDSTHTGTTQVYAGDGNAMTNERDDTIGINSISGVTTIHGQAGNDFIEVNVDAPVLPIDTVFAAPDPIIGLFERTHGNGIGAVLNLHGEGGSDLSTVNLAGDGAALINVLDNGAPDDGVDTLVVNGADVVTGLANQPDDTFLLRRDFVVLLNRSDPSGGFDQVERVSYDENINARLIVNGLGGDDTLVADDNSSITTLDGGDGNDTFQIGQVFGTPRTTAAGLSAGDTFDTTPIIIGVITDPASGAVIFDPTTFDPVNDTLDQATIDAINTAITAAGNSALDGIAYVSDGVSFATTAFGGDGEDTFNIYHNKGTLRLEGENDNDEFIVRAFVTVDLSPQGDTEVFGGAGIDTINYAINAPVSIDGGAGFDKVVVLGTPFNDAFVVTSEGIFGAGLNVGFENIESAELDALEGDDTIYVLGTNADIVTTVIGGFGSDTIEVMGDVVSEIISDEVLGRSGVISHGSSSGDPEYDNLGVEGVPVNIQSDGDSLVKVDPTGENLRVTEAGDVATYMISLVAPDLNALATNPVYMTVSAGIASTTDRRTGGESILVSVNGGAFTNAVVLIFDGTLDQTFEVEVMAIDDLAVEGPRVALVSHSINSANAAYDDLPILDVFVDIVDEQPALDLRHLLADGTGGFDPDNITEVLEGTDGFVDHYSIALTTAPLAGESVTVTLVTDSQITAVSDATGLSVLTFDAGNWDTPQIVGVTAAEDGKDGIEISAIEHVVQGGTVYGGAVAVDVPEWEVTVYDDETPGVIVQETEGSTIVDDDGATDTYRLRLTSQPAEDVVVTLHTDMQTTLMGDVATVSENIADGYFEYTVTFTDATWKDWAEVTVAANTNFAPSQDNVKSFATQDQNLDQIRGPLIIEGGAGEGETRAINAPVLLPGETDVASDAIAGETTETNDIDRLNIFHADNDDADTGALAYRTVDESGNTIENDGLALIGFEMGGDLTVNDGTSDLRYGGGITYNSFEIVELLLGKGDETLVVSDTGDRDEKDETFLVDPAAITAIHGGGGGDTITIDDRGEGPLVVYGDTSEDGARYGNTGGGASASATFFNNPGDDTIDAAGMTEKNDGFVGIVIFGGPGADTLTGSQNDDHIAGGSGPDTINGEAGSDHLFGDSTFNLDLKLFAEDQIAPLSEDADVDAMFTVPTHGTGDSDTIHGGADSDLIFGDHGEIEQSTLTRRIETTGNIVRAETVNLDDGDGDTIHGGAGNEFIFGGVGADTIFGDLGSDLIFGDFGQVAGTVDATRIGVMDGAGVTNPNATFLYTSDISAAADATAAGDTIYGGTLGLLDIDTGNNILLGQQGGDTIFGGGSNDDIYGGHNVAGGTDSADYIDGAAGADVILGDNGLIERTAAATDPRFNVLTGTLLYDLDGAVQVGDQNAIGANPDGTEVRLIALFDHDDSDTANAGKFGGDVIAGGSDDDLVFGQLGTDVLHGDGRLDGTGLATLTGTIAGSDVGGDDYVEGNGDGDTIYGGLGQDDLVGGSSGLYNLTTAAMRPDGADTIFGGNGDMTDRNDFGTAIVDEQGNAIVEEGARHARDSDAILGDNGNIFRLVGTNGVDSGVFLSFVYDNYDAQKIVVRAIDLLDYTPGGPSYDPSATNDIGAADVIRGESGDDFIYGMVGGDAIYGDAQDDDIVAGWGNDWISGGTGQDGVIGDDGRIWTSRNGTIGEPIYGVAPVAVDQTISTPGNLQSAVIHVDGALKKTVNLTPFNLTPEFDGDGIAISDDPLNDPEEADDLIYGGLGSDFLHGGAGDDLISGAETLATAWVEVTGHPTLYDGVYHSDYDAPFNPGGLLGYSTSTGEFAAYDEFAPLARILIDADSDGTATDEWFGNFAHDDPAAPLVPGGNVQTDGNDWIFGALGNDWLIGGTGQDHLWGGWGNDLLNADDDHTTNAGENDAPDTDASYEDIAYGGAGRDVLIANTGGDRLIDWTGEFNSYIVPFAPFGAFTISRQISPALQEYLYDLSEADGADPTRFADTNSGELRNGEPEGEIGLVTQQDDAWQDQTGAPDDPQPGNVKGGKRDVLRGADFNDDGAFTAFAADSGSWEVENGRLEVRPTSLGGDAVSVFHVSDYLPGYFEIAATISAEKPTGGAKANAYLIFDYISATNFKFAGVNISTDKIEMGRRTAEGWIVDVQTPQKVKPDQDYNLLLAANGTTATLVVNGQHFFTHVFAPFVDRHGVSHGLNAGMVGIGAVNSAARIDNVRVQILEREVTYQAHEDFEDATLHAFAADPADVADGALALDAGSHVFADVEVDENHVLRLRAHVSTSGQAGVYFDAYGNGEYKFVVLDVGNDKVLFGHYTPKRGVEVTKTVEHDLTPGARHDLEVTLKGTTISAVLDGSTLEGHVYYAPVTDGEAGLLAVDAADFTYSMVFTDDPIMLDDGEVVILGEAEALGAEALGAEAVDGATSNTQTVRVYSSTTGGAIPDLGSLTSTLRVGSEIVIADLDVELTLSHSRVSDLIVELIAPDGTVIRLATTLGASGDGYQGTIFDDDAAESITAATAPFTGAFVPEGDLSTLEGRLAAGDWTLRITDAARKETGTLLGWSLAIAEAQAILAAEMGSADNTAHPTGAEIDRKLQAAMDWWMSYTTLDAADIALLESVTVEIGTLSGRVLAITAEATITLDADAAGHGWWVDATPGDDAEFGDDGAAIAATVHGMDLLSVLVHELGHVLGHRHGDGAVMKDVLEAETRPSAEVTSGSTDIVYPGIVIDVPEVIADTGSNASRHWVDWRLAS